MIIIAPFSNDGLRDWPRAYFRDLIQQLLQNQDSQLVLVGAPEQRPLINLIIRGLPAPRVVSTAGLWKWQDTVDQVRQAELVIANNSGIAHLGAMAGVPTLCIFASSHDPHEWRARGPNVRTLYARTPCAPCGLSGAGNCRNGHTCMTVITPSIVLDTACKMLIKDRADYVK